MVDVDKFRTVLHKQLDEIINKMENDNIIEVPVQLCVCYAVTDEDAELVRDYIYAAWCVGLRDGTMCVGERFMISREFEDNKEVSKKSVKF